MTLYIMDSLIVYKLLQMYMIVMLLFQYFIYRLRTTDERAGADHTYRQTIAQRWINYMNGTIDVICVVIILVIYCFAHFNES